MFKDPEEIIMVSIAVLLFAVGIYFSFKIKKDSKILKAKFDKIYEDELAKKK